jgi:hypothetical protein
MQKGGETEPMHNKDCDRPIHQLKNIGLAEVATFTSNNLILAAAYTQLNTGLKRAHKK